MYSCYFQIPRGNTNRYVFVFYLKKNGYYYVQKKVLLGNSPYKTILTYNVNKDNLTSFINTTVANTY